MTSRNSIYLIIVIVIIGIVGIIYVTNDLNEMTSLPSENPSVEVSDDIVIEKNIVPTDNNNPNYYIDENGIKRYGISAIDSPDLSD